MVFEARRTLRLLLQGWYIVGLLALALLGGCSPGRNLEPVAPYNGTVYRLGVGDQVRVIIYGEQQLSQDFRISDNGSVAIPLLGEVHAAGLTSPQLGEQIAGDLKRMRLLRNPSVAVEVETYRPVSLLGEVTKPGQYPYQPGMTMLTAVAAAGGFTYRAVEGYAMVVRQKEPEAVTGKILPQDYVQPGDVIKVYERLF